ncbi:MAG: hypothetical protein A2139_08630 [Desulfobacca sp. RBG_16_60_12]|nr:MAG: hypothetical protein A2139_08630 [Desulfobacca sp. RBG_16_60_12]
MISSQPGTGISLSEVTNIEPLGFWILVDDREYFVPFADYPVFQGTAIQQIFQMPRVSPTQLHWPDLNADIEIDALDQPEHYPLIFK